MVANYVLACNKIDSILENKFEKIEVNSFTGTVDDLAELISKFWNLHKDSFDIVCFGKHLDTGTSLDSCGIQNGTLLYLMKKKEPPVAYEPPKQTFEEDGSFSQLPSKYQGMCVALKSALLNSGFRQILENVSDFEKRENLMVVNPELRTDPSMFGILGDPELLNAYISRVYIKRILNRYPTFLEVATHIAATFHEEISNVNLVNNLVNRGSLMNYAIDAVSEDDEMDESETSSLSSNNTASSNRLSDSAPMSLSNMIMRAYQNRQLNNNNNSSGAITQDMLRQALQTTSTTQSSQSSSSSLPESVPTSDLTSVASSSGQSASSSSQPPAPAPQQRSTAQILIGWAPQLAQMRELGITDDIVAIQALEAAYGDVQAALNIIFSDFN